MDAKTERSGNSYDSCEKTVLKESINHRYLQDRKSFLIVSKLGAGLSSEYVRAAR